MITLSLTRPMKLPSLSCQHHPHTTTLSTSAVLLPSLSATTSSLALQPSRSLVLSSPFPPSPQIFHKSRGCIFFEVIFKFKISGGFHFMYLYSNPWHVFLMIQFKLVGVPNYTPVRNNYIHQNESSLSKGTEKKMLEKKLTSKNKTIKTTFCIKFRSRHLVGKIWHVTFGLAH